MTGLFATQKIFDILSADSIFRARMIGGFFKGNVKDNPNFPCGRVVAEEILAADSASGGDGTLRSGIYNVDLYAKDYKDAEAAADEADRVLRRYRNNGVSPPIQDLFIKKVNYEYSDEMKIHAFTLTILVFYG